MIEVFNEIYTECAKALRNELSGIFVTGESVSAPPKFPCACGTERSNITYIKSLDNALKEHHANIMIQWDYYSNLKSGKLAQCRKMASVVDDVMLGHGFTRTMLEPVDNPADENIGRIVARYTAVVSENKIIYRR